MPNALCRVGAAAASIAWPALIPAQQPPTVDPFTLGDAARMQVLGIQAYAPMPWADDHSTADIERELGLEGKVAWLETEHFKIGIQYAYKDRPKNKDEKKALQQECDALAALVPEFKAAAKGKGLSNWLLAHLYAQRLETLYDDFSRRVGFSAPPTDPVPGGHDGRGFQRRGGLGKGPFLGQHGKFCVLVLETQGGLARYFKRFAGRDEKESNCHHFLGSNSLAFVTTPDLRTAALPTERALHCNIVYGVVRNFVTGLNGFTYEIPIWNVEGLAHWYRRKLDPDYNSIAALPESQWGLLHEADWAQKARGRAENGAFAPARELLHWQLADLRDFHKHVMTWSRVDFLLAQGDEKYGRYLNRLKSLPNNGAPAQMILDRQDQALREVYGFDADGFDAAWVAWVKQNYERAAR